MGRQREGWEVGSSENQGESKADFKLYLWDICHQLQRRFHDPEGFIDSFE